MKEHWTARSQRTQRPHNIDDGGPFTTDEIAVDDDDTYLDVFEGAPHLFSAALYEKAGSTSATVKK